MPAAQGLAYLHHNSIRINLTSMSVVNLCIMKDLAPISWVEKTEFFCHTRVQSLTKSENLVYILRLILLPMVRSAIGFVMTL